MVEDVEDAVLLDSDDLILSEGDNLALGNFRDFHNYCLSLPSSLRPLFLPIGLYIQLISPSAACCLL